MVPMMDNGIVDTVSHHLLHFPEELEKLLAPPRSERKGSSATVPVDILQTAKEYVFILDVPGLSKSDIQVMVEDDKTLVLKGQGKRRREEEQECRYIRMERKVTPRFTRKFTLPDDANVTAVSAKCENGVLSVTVTRNPPVSNKTIIEVPIA